LTTEPSGHTASDGLDIILGGGVNPDAYVWNRENGPLKFGTNNTERMSIAADGAVTIAGTSVLTIPVGTTAQRPASPVNGMIRFNTTTGKIDVYNPLGWGEVAAYPPVSTTGGTITTTATHKYHTFTGSGTFVCSGGTGSLDVEYLVIAGGGTGGKARTNGAGYEAGGGGAGGYISGSLGLASNSYSIVVGAGGAHPSNGSNTTALGLTAIGGGGGQGSGTSSGNSGGSGGGGSYNANGGSGTSGQGYAGAHGTTSGGNRGGGGGGAGEVGNADGDTAGGDGLAWEDGVYRAGGGSGGNRSNDAGVGGGGQGASSLNGTSYAGAANTGGGGGGAYSSSTSFATSNGGSGIVIIRYAI
jgi:hypothetical protein